jgi:hypothetical protein
MVFYFIISVKLFLKEINALRNRIARTTDINPPGIGRMALAIF